MRKLTINLERKARKELKKISGTIYKYVAVIHRVEKRLVQTASTNVNPQTFKRINFHIFYHPFEMFAWYPKSNILKQEEKIEIN